ncbi:MAG: hypothetical protein ACM3QW_03325 [Ignavibacteriales bacterium]
MKKKFIYAILLLIAAGIIYGGVQYKQFATPPTTRLAAGSYYPEMPPDELRHYIQLPLDHGDLSKGNFTAFYYTNPDFKPGGPVVFWLCDNQQELVGMLTKDEHFGFYDQTLGGLSYVLIGNRGVSPTLFPEVFNRDGSVNYELAMNLYGSAQQVEDIEAVRKDLQRQHILRPDGKIMLYGGSGGGVLEQQYLDKYGDRVSRVLIESSGAPDLARQHNAPFITNLYDSNLDAAKAYYSLSRKGSRLSLAYTLFKIGLEGNKDLQTRVAQSQTRIGDLKGKLIYLENWIKPAQNYPLIKMIIGTPTELEVRVRIFEVMGADLQNYHPTTVRQVNLGYEWSQDILADFLLAAKAGKISPMKFDLDRSSFKGEVMVWSGTEDQDFSLQMGKWLSDSYPNSRWAIFRDAHKRGKYPAYYRNFRKEFFLYGMNSPRTQSCFNDPRQLNLKERNHPSILGK